jgi:hypothetical protein
MVGPGAGMSASAMAAYWSSPGPIAHMAVGNRKPWGTCLTRGTSTLMPSLLDTFFRMLQADRLNCGPFHWPES